MTEQKDYRKALFYEQKNGYDLIDADEAGKAEQYCAGYKEFLNEARTEREAVAIAVEMAKKEGFAEYKPGMRLTPGTKLYSPHAGGHR